MGDSRFKLQSVWTSRSIGGAVYIVLNRGLCKKAPDACTSCFAAHIRSGDFAVADCFVSLDLQDRAELIFNIIDRDESFKKLVVKEENLDKALHSWQALWEEQAGLVI